MNKIKLTSAQNINIIRLHNYLKKYLNYLGRRYSANRGNKMVVYANDWIGLAIYIDGVYEMELLSGVAEIVKHVIPDSREFIALDIGANIGNHTIFFSKIFGKVVSFEPNLYTYKLLEFNTQFYDNIELHNFGLSDKEESLSFYENTINYGASSAVYRGDSNFSTTINVKRLDDSISENSQVKLIKIDVEGMESLVLKGALNTINDCLPVILFEQQSKDFNVKDSETQAISLLRDLGYIMYVFKERETFISKILPKFFKTILSIFSFRRRVKYLVKIDKVMPGSYPLIVAIHKSNAYCKLN